MEQHNQPAKKYFLYARKSTESEDKQMASIESQINELKKIAKQNNLQVVKIFSESKSAKEPGRPIYNEMITKIKQGEADGVICWKINRLARNPVDGGEISWMLQQGIIKNIQTYGKIYYPTDNVIVMAVELGMANQFIRDLSIDTKRGLKNKAKEGWFPGVAKPGYTNEKYSDKGTKRILKDKDRFYLIQKAFKKILERVYRPSEVLEILNDKWGYTTLKRKKLGGIKMAKSTFYSILSDSFYYGFYEFPKNSGNWYKGKHEPMITEKEFDRIQEIIGNKNYSRPRKNKIEAFYGFFKCEKCSSSISPNQKIQTICSSCKYKFSSKHRNSCPKCNTQIENMKKPKHLEYLYYGCTKKKNKNCSQKGIRSDKLENEILKLLGNLTISEDMRDWYIERLNEVNFEEEKDRFTILKILNGKRSDSQQKLDNLIKLKISPQNTNDSLLSDEDFKKQKNIISKEIDQTENEINNLKNRNEEWIEATINTFNFACYAKYHFKTGDIKIKKTILTGLGANLLIKNRKPIISLPPHLEILKTTNDKINEIGITPEPKDFSLTKEKTGSLEPVFSAMLRILNEIRTFFKENPLADLDD